MEVDVSEDAPEVAGAPAGGPSEAPSAVAAEVPEAAKAPADQSGRGVEEAAVQDAASGSDAPPREAVVGGIPDSFKSELYYLMAKFLQGDPRTESAAAALRADLDRGRLLTPRYDWTGRSHDKTFEEVSRDVGDEGRLPPDHLLKLCFRLSSLGVHGVRGAATSRSLVGRHAGADGRRAKPDPHCLVALGHRQLGLSFPGVPAGVTSQRSLTVRVSRRLQHQRRTLGHLSAVYCLLFDRTGRFVFTGADDLLVKCWQIRDGRLVFTFRGASSEISDLAVSHDNLLLAAGSCDKNIRVWCLRTAAPVAVLTKHTGMITAVNFSPVSCEDKSYQLASTSGDGTVSFWRFRYNDHGMAVFDETPTRYHEKIRPGQATMLCASFSPGGTFFCVGSADHNVRVYQMTGPEGPQRILEEEAHDDRVDSIQWCNRPDQLKFVSGSKDGTARIWTFHAKRWHTVVLNMKSGDNSRPSPPPSKNERGTNGVSTSSSRGRNVAANGNQQANLESEYRVTMVAWTIDDSLVITAVSDKTLKVWDADKCTLQRSLRGHEEEIFVLEPHPTSWNLLLSSAHDGQLRVWDLEKGECLFKHRNIVEENGQECGHAAVYDAKWSPDGLSVAASDSHGHLLFIGHGSTEAYNRLPVELFFHTDYRPLLRDSFHNVVDEQTQVPPHLLPPPFLVDAEGSPYPGYIQTFVPGREKMSENEALLPGDAAALGQARDQLQQIINQQQEQLPAPGQRVNPAPAPEEAGRSAMPGLGGAAHDEPQAGPSHRSPSVQERPQQPDGPASQQEARPSQVTHSQRRILLDKDCSNKIVKKRFEARKMWAAIEASVLEAEMSRTVTDHVYARLNSANASKAKKKISQGGRRGGNAQAGGGGAGPAAGSRRLHREEEDEEENEENANDTEENSDDSSLDESDLLSMESTTEEETTDHSDWGSDADETKSEKSSPMAAEKRRSQQQEQRNPGKAKAKKRNAAQVCRDNMLRNPGDITEDFIPSPWLSESFPKKTPYFPQIGDVLMYFKQGHEKYIDLVKMRKSYDLNMKEQLWMRKKTIGDFCLVKVTNMKFEIRPPRLCVLKLSLLSQNGMRATGDSFTIKYHDMNDVVNFLVLHDIYRGANRGKSWKNGDRIRCQIDDCWWKGTVKKVEHHDAAKRSPFLSIYVHWDNGEKEHLSPWDLEVLTEDTADVPDGSSVTPEQLKQSLYQPKEEEWNSMGIETETRRISEALEGIMSLAIAEPFNFPVDLTAYPEYMLDIDYPMDLNLIKTRVDNHFYRRIDALVYDLKYIYANAASFNRPRSDIVKNAKIITKLAQEIVGDPSKTKDDVSSIYHRLQSEFSWSEDDEDDGAGANDEGDEEEEQEGEEPGPSTSSRSKRTKSLSKSPPTLNPKKWKHDCNELLNDMVNHPLSVPFRQPVNEVEFPDYHRYITTPMDLATVRESLHIGDYDSPVDFHKDVLLIFKNSREYNTDKTAKIWSMTNKLEDWFEDRFRDVLHEWRKTNRRISMAKSRKTDKKDNRQVVKGKGKGKGKGQSNKIRKAKQSRTFSEEDEDDELDEEEPSSELTPAKRKAAKVRQDSSSDDEGEFEEKMPTPSTSRSKALQNRAKREARQRSSMSSSVTAPRPNMFESQSSAAGRRISSRIPKPPIRYRDNLGDREEEEEEDERLLASRRSQRVSRPNISMRERSGSEEEEEEAAPRASAGSPQGGRPRRHRRPVRHEHYTYSEGEDDEDSPRHSTRQRTPQKKKVVLQEATPRKSSATGDSRVNGIQPGGSGAGPSSSSAASRIRAVSTTDDDDVPLARRLSAKARTNSVTGEATKKAEAKSPKSSPTATAGQSTRYLRGTPKKSRKDESESEEEEEEDSSEDEEEESEDDLPLKRKAAKGKGRAKERLQPKRSPPTRGSTRRKKPESESEFEEEDEEEEEESDFEDSDEVIDFGADDDDDDDFIVDEDDVPISKSRRAAGKKRRPPQRRAAMQPKRNKSKRAAAAIDSESERTSARKPSRLTARNAAKTARAGDGGEREMRRAANKRSYYEGDEDEEEESGRENRRPRRAAAAKRPRWEEEEDEDFDEEENLMGLRGRKRQANPRII